MVTVLPFIINIMRDNLSLDDTIRQKVERTLCSIQTVFKFVGVVETNFKLMLNSFPIGSISMRTPRLCKRRMMDPANFGNL